MSYQENKVIVDALRKTSEWLEREGNIIRPASVAREMTKLTVDCSSRPELTCRVAALSLLLFKAELNADNVAWLVRDGTIGFPEKPTFNFFEAYK